MATVLKADPEAYLKLSRQRDSRVRLRIPIAILAVLAALVAAVLALTAPAPVKLAILAVAVAVFGKLGAPADRPLIDRAVTGSRAEKLTSDVVIRALASLGLAAINQAVGKNPKTAIEFKAPITRDGPGWRADLDLPYGVTVAEVMDRRDKLASGLRRQLGCVWPEADHAQHTGRLILWVGDQDMSTARQPAFPLAKTGAADLFKPVAFGTDQRGRTVPVTLMFVSVIIGAIPRMGKTFLLRLLALIAALDVRAELHLYDFKGTGDLSPLEPVAHRYRAGDDDEDLAYALADFRALREELRRRTKVIRGLPRDICPENKVTPDLASNKTLRLHPVVVGVDECQVMFEHPKHGDRVRGHLHRRGQARPGDRDRADPGHPAPRRQVAAHRHQRERGAADVPEGHGPDRKRHGARHVGVQERRPRHHVRLQRQGHLLLRRGRPGPPHRARLLPRRPRRREDRPAGPGPARTRRNPVRARPRAGTRHRARVRSAGRPGRRGHRTQDVVRGRSSPGWPRCGPARTRRGPTSNRTPAPPS